jgi:predicted transglutaminase-like cysteine proteinase
MSRPACWLAPLAALIVLCGTAESASAQPRSAMPLGAEAVPPPGLISLCRREPEACRSPGVSTADVLMQAEAAARDYWRHMFVRADAPTPPSATGPAASSPGPTLPSAVHERLASDAAANNAVVDLSSPLWRAVTAVNAEINAAIRAEDDQRAYRQADYWAIPRATVRVKPVGDCEDFALAKRERLLALGVPAETLSIALVRTRTGLSHAVLLVATDEGEYVLDNLTPWVVHWTEARLTWRERQAPGQMLQWVYLAAE